MDKLLAFRLPLGWLKREGTCLMGKIKQTLEIVWENQADLLHSLKIAVIPTLMLAAGIHGLSAVNMPVASSTYVIAKPSLNALYPLTLQAAKPVAVEVAESRSTGEARVARIERAASARATAGRQENPVSRSTRSLADLRGLYQAAGNAYGVPWQIIEAVHQVETGKSTDTAVRNPSGATGPMQFMPGTWRKYATDGNGDGRAEITSVDDAVFAAAKYLAANNASQNINQALLAYNHSESYVKQVKSVAASIQE